MTQTYHAPGVTVSGINCIKHCRRAEIGRLVRTRNFQQPYRVHQNLNIQNLCRVTGRNSSNLNISGIESADFHLQHRHARVSSPDTTYDQRWRFPSTSQCRRADIGRIARTRNFQQPYRAHRILRIQDLLRGSASEYLRDVSGDKTDEGVQIFTFSMR